MAQIIGSSNVAYRLKKLDMGYDRRRPGEMASRNISRILTCSETMLRFRINELSKLRKTSYSRFI